MITGAKLVPVSESYFARSSEKDLFKARVKKCPQWAYCPRGPFFDENAEQIFLQPIAAVGFRNRN